MGWVVHHDNSDWTATGGYGSWDSGNSEWDSVNFNSIFEVVLIIELGTWVDSYRPTKVRVTFTGATNACLGLQDKNGDPIAEEGELAVSYTYQSLEEIDIIFGSYDIEVLLIAAANGDTFSITNIEFYEADSGWTHIINGVANASISKVNGVDKANISKINGV